MATLYYNAAVDTNWNTLGNWWTSDAFTTQASALPTSSDSVVLIRTCQTNNGSQPTVVNLTFNDPDGVFPVLSMTVIVTGIATFNDDAYNYPGGTIGGDATFNHNAYNFGSVTLDATFNGSSINDGGTIGGDATFNGSSANGTTYGYPGASTVTGNATFNDNSVNIGGTITGNATFSLSSASAQIRGGHNGTYSNGSASISFAYSKGINGSSILGVV